MIKDPNPADYGGTTLLHLIAKKGHEDLCKIMMSKVLNKNPVNQNGNTPLHWAANNGHTSIAKLIMEQSWNINPKNLKGETPFHAAVNNGNFKLCAMILERVTEKNPKNTNLCIFSLSTMRSVMSSVVAHRLCHPIVNLHQKDVMVPMILVLLMEKHWTSVKKSAMLANLVLRWN